MAGLSPRCSWSICTSARKPLVQMRTANWMHPVLVRLCKDKVPEPVDTRIAQVFDRYVVGEAAASTHALKRPVSEALTRGVCAKAAKGKVAVRKPQVCTSHKDEADPGYPAFGVHWPDYAAGRGTPLEREVRTAPTLELAQAFGSKMAEDNVKKGLEEVAVV